MKANDEAVRLMFGRKYRWNPWKPLVVVIMAAWAVIMGLTFGGGKGCVRELCQL